MTQEEREREAREAQEEEAEAQAEEAAEAVDENQELVAKVPDASAHTGTIDTSGAAAKTVAEQMETITPGQMADTGHTEDLQEVVDRSEAESEGQETEPESRSTLTDEGVEADVEEEEAEEEEAEEDA